jgi:hypothetical protein
MNRWAPILRDECQTVLRSRKYFFRLRLHGAANPFISAPAPGQSWGTPSAGDVDEVVKLLQVVFHVLQPEPCLVHSGHQCNESVYEYILIFTRGQTRLYWITSYYIWWFFFTQTRLRINYNILQDLRGAACRHSELFLPLGSTFHNLPWCGYCKCLWSRDDVTGSLYCFCTVPCFVLRFILANVLFCYGS